VPTRELVDQISKVFKLLSHDTGIRIVSLYGGVSHEEQIKDLKYGADIVISTTGRLLDFLKSKLVNLNMIETLIIDEADRLLEMGFEKQLNEIMNSHGNFILYYLILYYDFIIVIKFTLIIFFKYKNRYA
jgi:superfamily II DNA/RNA helicase